MFRKCPRCNSFNVRPSLGRTRTASTDRFFQTFFRCRDCHEHFWKTSASTYYGIGMVAVTLIGGAIVWTIGGFQWDRTNAPATLAPVTARLADSTRLAEKGDAVAAYELAQIYARGNEVPRNDKESRAWLERAAQNGNAEAQYELGMALLEGRGSLQDFERALSWLKKAADRGDGRAQLEVGRMYRDGKGIRIDNVKAYVWLNLAAAQGISGAALLRDSLLPLLTRDQIVEAQTEARRLSEQAARSSTAP